MDDGKEGEEIGFGTVDTSCWVEFSVEIIEIILLVLLHGRIDEIDVLNKLRELEWGRWLIAFTGEPYKRELGSEILLGWSTSAQSPRSGIKGDTLELRVLLSSEITTVFDSVFHRHP